MSRRAETRQTRSELLLGYAALAAAFILNYEAGRLSSRLGAHAHTSPDLLFRVLPLWDMRFFFVWGFAAFVACAVLIGLLRERNRLAYMAWSFALLIALRSFFIILTPMKLPREALPIVGYPIFDRVGTLLTFDNDLFFSSHTALPFLGSLIYRDWWARRLFLGFSLLMAATVLLTRQHYSIDVFAAFFITYALHRAEARLFQVPYAAWKRRCVAVRDQSPMDKPVGLGQPV